MFATTDVSGPEALGIDPSGLEALMIRAGREVADGLLPSCQFAVARHGHLAAFATIGEASDTTRYVIFSATKALVAAGAWLLIAEGRLDPSARVGDLVGEFATNGKEAVTVEQVMLHTCGFPTAPLGAALFNDREGRLQRFGTWRLNWEPGTAFMYHATSAHWVLAELIERASGQDFRDFLRQRITAKLGLDLHLGVPVEAQHNIARLVMVGTPASADEMEAVTGVRFELPADVSEAALLGLNDPQAIAAGIPGGGAIATAAGLALFYQALLLNPGQLWDPDVLHDATTNVRNHFIDPMVGVPANRSLGLVIAGDDGKSSLRHNFGRTVSPRAFGHSGAGGQIAWADPDTGLSFAYVTNGLDANLIREGRRGVALSSLAGALTGLPSGKAG